MVNCNFTYNTINNERKFCNCKCFQSYDAHTRERSLITLPSSEAMSERHWITMNTNTEFDNAADRYRDKCYSAFQRYIVVARLRYYLFLSLSFLLIPSFGT